MSLKTKCKQFIRTIKTIIAFVVSLKGNSPDNGIMESFWASKNQICSTPIDYKSLDDLEQAMIKYIDYYNSKRIKIKLKGFSPMQYRTKLFLKNIMSNFGSPYKMKIFFIILILW